VASARPDDHERCRAAGADAVVDYRDAGLAERLHEEAPSGFDVLWDTSGRNDLDLFAELAAPGARVLLTAATSPRAHLPVARLYTRDVTLHGFVLSRAAVDDLGDAAGLIGSMLREGALAPRISAVLPLTETAEVHARLEAGTVRGRLLLRP
jgi:NADPH:quinone reductase-like Zn-dependent oxidoreductase